MAGRVLEATSAFWVLAILSDPAGGALAWLIAPTWGTGLAATTGIVGVLLAAALAAQFFTRRCNPWIASTAFLLAGAFAALVTDDLLVLAGATPEAVAAAFGGLLGVTLAMWFVRDRTLWAAEVRTRRSEVSYWLSVLLASGLGTAIGRGVAQALGLKPVLSTALFTAVICVVVVARIMFDVDRALCFWVALVLTRPLGAALGDLFAFPPRDGGLGVAGWATSILFLVLVSAAVISLALSLRQRRAAARMAAATEASSS